MTDSNMTMERLKELLQAKTEAGKAYDKAHKDRFHLPSDATPQQVIAADLVVHRTVNASAKADVAYDDALKLFAGQEASMTDFPYHADQLHEALDNLIHCVANNGDPTKALKTGRIACENYEADLLRNPSPRTSGRM